MEKINRANIIDLPSLKELKTNWEAWGQEFRTQLENGEKSSGFNWRGIYDTIVEELNTFSKDHCSFCDSHPLGKDSKITIEHYYPKKEFPLFAYNWNNLFLCCDKCQSEANKQKNFLDNLKPDHTEYFFDSIFYFDPSTGRLEIIESLEFENAGLFEKANNFIKRYGLNNESDTKNKRCYSRRLQFQNLKNYFKNKGDDFRTRDDFEFRYIYDYVELLFTN